MKYGQTSPTVDPKTKDKIDALIEKLKDENKNVRSNAARALRKIGPPAKDAIPALTKLLKSDAQEMRRTAEDALKKIRAEK